MALTSQARTSGQEFNLQQVCDGCHSDVVRVNLTRASKMMATVAKASHRVPVVSGDPRLCRAKGSAHARLHLTD